MNGLKRGKKDTYRVEFTINKRSCKHRFGEIRFAPPLNHLWDLAFLAPSFDDCAVPEQQI